MSVMLKRRPVALTAAIAACLFGLAACGGGGGGDGGGDGDGDGDPTPTGYSGVDERPAAVTAPVGSSVSALSEAVGIGGAARLTGSIPAPAAPAPMRRALSGERDYTGRAEAARKVLAADGKAPMIASSDTNIALIQGAWVSGTSSVTEGYYFDGSVRYSVTVPETGGSTCGAFDADRSNVTTSTTLENRVTAVSNTALVMDGVTYSRPSTAEQAEMLACLEAAGYDVGGGTVLPTPDGPDFNSLVGQVSFSDNSTFQYSFSSSTAPTAVFVQIDGADEYFVVPRSALTVNGTTYSFNFFGPTPSASVEQVINVQLTGTITVRAFYGNATPQQLLTSSFPGATDESNWSTPAYVDCVAQPARAGAFQATLTWNNEADLDLYVEEPDGTSIDYGSPHRADEESIPSPAGGLLDVDDTNGFGPENIYYAAAPSVAGTYKIWVHHFYGPSPSSYTLTITRNGVPQTYSGTLTSGGESTPIEVTIP